jgi:nucleoside-diphosphate-sugar epimerase
MRIAVTGANGFVGQALVRQLADNGHQLLAYVRRSEGFASIAGVTPMASPDLGPHADWRLRSEKCIDVLVHTAARVHVMEDDAADPLAKYRRVNVAGTLALAQQAVAAGVRRFVFLSSIKVNGESTAPDVAFCRDDRHVPDTPYGLSKLEAEQGLARIAAQSGMELAVVRPPLVYGPGVGANFLRRMDGVRRGLPMPFRRVRNARSLVYVGNLASALAQCCEHPGAVGKTYLVSDGAPVSTPELISAIAAAMGRPARLLPVPSGLMQAAASILGKGEEAERVLGSLVVDDTPLVRELGWTPPYTFEAGLRATVNWYLSRSDV